MKKILLFTFLLVHICIFSQQKLKTENAHFFYENKGQIVDQNGKENTAVKFLFNSPGLNVQIKNDGFSYDVYEVEKIQKNSNQSQEKENSKSKSQLKNEFNTKSTYHRIDINFVNANKSPQIIAEGKSQDFDNYYNLPNKPQGVTNVYRYQKITYKNIYPYVDLVFFKPTDSSKTIEYNFIVNPGGRISDIKMKFDGAKTKLSEGKLEMKLHFGKMQESIPHSWEETGLSNNSINVQFKDLGNQIFGFASEKNISDKTIVIDPIPTRIWGSYFSGSWYDNKAAFIVSDSDNNVYFGGQTSNPTNIATVGTHQFFILNDNYDNGFAQKFDENGQRVWGTYIGNLLYSTIVYDGILNNDALYVGGTTFDQTGGINNITTPGVHKQFASANTREAFIMKLNLNGQRVWGTYYGGTGYEDIYDMDFDINGNVLVSGYTSSEDQIATVNAHIPNSQGSNSGFFSKFSPSGQLLYGSYFYRPINHITSDKNNNILIAGQYINGLGLPNIGTIGTHQPNMQGNYNAFILKFDSNFTKLWGSYFGGVSNYASDTTSNNYISGISTDTNNNIIIAGTTISSNNIATPGSYKEIHAAGQENGFIAKFHPDGKIDWSTYYGSEDFSGNAITSLFVNEKDDIFVAGDTRSSRDIATPNGYQPTSNNSDDGYFAKFSKNGFIVWGSYYANRFQDFLQKITYKNNFVYVIGYTTGTDYTFSFGTPGTFMPEAYAGYYLAKFRDCQNNVQGNSNSPVCPGSTINLQASGGTSYSWTGPNGYTSSQQNPVISNATLAHSGIYSCTISGTGDCDGTFTVEVKVEDKTPPVPNSINLPTITGNCKTVITTIPTATDSCMGIISATTTNPLHYSLPGNYVITWTYTDGNGNISTQNQNVTITSEAIPNAATQQSFCKIWNPKISDIQITGTSIKWYDNSGSLLNINTPLTDGTKYYATQTLNGCESAKTEVIVTINDPSPPTGSSLQNFCAAQNPTLTTININGQNITWYDQTGQILSATTSLVDGQTYYATQNINGCESAQKLAVQVSVANGGVPANDYSKIFCNDTTSNSKEINLLNYKSNLITNPENYSFEFYNTNNQIISDPSKVNLNLGNNQFSVKIKSYLGCFALVKLELTLNPKPSVTLPATAEFCDGLSIELKPGSGFLTYEWTVDGNPTPISNLENLLVNQSGKYTVKVTNQFGCENTATTIVTKSIIASIVKVDIINNTATVILSQNGDFLFSTDNLNWQNSNVFSNLSNGNHRVYVKTLGGCSIEFLDFSIFSISNSFTPNGDGINDTWKIGGIENYPNSEISVTDRYGNLVLHKMTNGPFEWNGMLNSRPLPTGNYWYVIKVSDGRILNGWLLVKNRN